MKKTLYTAIGRFERRTSGMNRSYPVIILGDREYQADLQEMAVWTCLNWRIARREEIGAYYEKTLGGTNLPARRSLRECIDRLVTRGLVISGCGDTEYDALYDLLSSLYVIPTGGSPTLRMASFLKLTLFSHVPFSAAKRLFQKDRRSSGEQRVMGLAKQALLSTAEIIKCVEKGVFSLPDDESILSALYSDSDTTSDNLSYLVKASPCSKPVILAVANLYLRQQIIFERI